MGKFMELKVLQSKKDNNFYADFTENLKLRFEQHDKGYARPADQSSILKSISQNCD